MGIIATCFAELQVHVADQLQLRAMSDDELRDLGIGRSQIPHVVVDYVTGDIRAAMPRFVEPALAHNLALVDRFDAIAVEAGCTPGQLALAWLLDRDDFIVPIPGTRSIAHLEENIIAASLSIDPAMFAKVDSLLPPGALHGPRYAAAMQAQIDTETFPNEELARPAV